MEDMEKIIVAGLAIIFAYGLLYFTSKSVKKGAKKCSCSGGCCSCRGCSADNSKHYITHKQ